MTDQEAIEVLFNEWKCIDRNDGIHCDRKCENCDLVMDASVIREAYNLAVTALEARRQGVVYERREDVPDTNVGENCSEKPNSSEEAITELKMCIDIIKQDGRDYLDERDIPMLEMAINALERESCVDALKDADQEIRKLPSVTPKPKTGKWVRHYCEDDGYLEGWACDQCNDWWYFGEKKPKFCPDAAQGWTEVSRNEAIQG